MSTRTVDVTVTMSPKLLERLDRHLEEVGEPKRSPWIRAAIRRKLAEEEAELRDEFEEVED